LSHVTGHADLTFFFPQFLSTLLSFFPNHSQSFCPPFALNVKVGSSSQHSPHSVLQAVNTLIFAQLLVILELPGPSLPSHAQVFLETPLILKLLSLTQGSGEAVGLRVVGAGVGAFVGAGETVGLPIGAAEGLWEGWSEGVPVGFLLGSPLGFLEGLPDGDLDGSEDGAPDGLLLGVPDGAKLGSADGFLDGVELGSLDGAALGSNDGCLDGVELGSLDGAALGSNDG